MTRSDPIKTIVLIRRYWGLYLIAVVSATVAQVVGIPLALLTRRMVNLVAHESASHLEIAQIERSLFLFASFLVGLTLLRGLARWARGVLGEIFAQRCLTDLRLAMLEKLCRVSLGYFDKRAAGKIVVRFVGDAQGLRSWFATRIVGLPSDILTILAVLTAIGLINLQLLLAVIIPPLLLIPVVLLINPRSRTWTRSARREQSRLTGDLTRMSGMAAALRVSGGADQMYETMRERVAVVASSFIRRSIIDSTGTAMSLMLGSLSLCAIGVWGSVLILHGEANTGDIVGAIWLSVLLRSPINRLTSTNIAWHRVRVAFDRIDALMSRREIRSGGELGQWGTGKPRLRVKGLGFSEPNDGGWLFRDVNAIVEGHGTVLVRGSARSTGLFCSFLLGVRKPTEGRIGINGMNVRKYAPHDLHAHIGWVDGARGVILARTLRDGIDSVHHNLMTADLGLDPDEARNVLEMVEHAERAIADGGLLWLRVALGCALIDEPEILLIDQPAGGLGPSDLAWFIEFVRRESERRMVLIGTNRGLGLSGSVDQIRLDGK